MNDNDIFKVEPTQTIEELFTARGGVVLAGEDFVEAYARESICQSMHGMSRTQLAKKLDQIVDDIQY